MKKIKKAAEHNLLSDKRNLSPSPLRSVFILTTPRKVDTQSRDRWSASALPKHPNPPFACQQPCEEGLIVRQYSLFTSTLKLHRIIAPLSGRQAVSMHYGGPKTPRGSWMCTICLVVAERATFVESGN